MAKKWEERAAEDYCVDFSAQSTYERLMARELRGSEFFKTLNEDDKKIIERHARECAHMGRFLNEIENKYPEQFKNC